VNGLYIGRVRGENFGPFEKADYDLGSAGLTVVEGRMVGVEGCDSNGSGKSMLLELATWTLYDRCLRNDYKSDDVIRHGAAWCCGSVEVHGAADGEVLTVSRYRGHPEYGSVVKVFVGGTEVTRGRNDMTDALIEHYLGMNYTTYINVLAFGARQDVKSFFTSSDGDRKAILEKLLALEAYSKAREVATDDIAKIQQELSAARGRLESAQVQHAALCEKIATIKAAATGLGDDPEIAVLSAKVAAKSKFRAWKAQERLTAFLVSDLALSRAEHAAATAHYTEVVKELDSAVEAARKARDPALSNLSAARTTLAMASRPLSFGNAGKACSSCGQTIPHKHSPAQRKAMEDARDAKIAEASAAVEAATKALATADAIYTASIEDRDEARQYCPKPSIDTATVIYLLNESRERQVALKEQYNAMVAKRDSIARQYADVTATLAKEQKIADDLSSLIEGDLTSGVAVAEGDYADAVFWRDGFSDAGIKSFLIESVLPEVNKYATMYAQTLRGHGAVVRMSATKRLKTTKAVREQTTIDAIIPGCAKKYGGASKGQRLRLDLALLLAFRKLASKRASKPVMQLFADEIFDGMDRSGCARVIELLREIAAESPVVLISHDSRIKKDADRVLTVVHSGDKAEVVTSGAAPLA